MPTRHSNARAKNLRNRPTETEHRLWGRFRAKQIEKLKFRRQAPIGPYIVDFVCHEKRIIIEVDGGQHSLARAEMLKERNGSMSKDIGF